MVEPQTNCNKRFTDLYSERKALKITAILEHYGKGVNF